MTFEGFSQHNKSGPLKWPSVRLTKSIGQEYEFLRQPPVASLLNICSQHFKEYERVKSAAPEQVLYFESFQSNFL
jgi:hypothetical protein